MFLKFARTKKRHFLLSLFYKLDTFFPLTKERKLKLYLDLEWIFERLAHEKSFLVFKEHPVRNKSFQFLKSKLTKEFSVLDLGCNTGDLTYQISTCVKNVVGIDFNSAHIVKARKTYIQENIQFIHGEVIEYLQQNSQRFDVMILSHILEHIENPESFLVSCKKFFRYIYIEVPDFERSHLNVYRHELGSKLIYSDVDHIWEFDRTSMKEVIQKTGLEIIEEEYRLGVQKYWCRMPV